MGSLPFHSPRPAQCYLIFYREGFLKIKEPVCIVPAGDVCGEGVLWDRDSQSLYWTDINRFLVHRYSLAEGAVKTWLFSEPVTCVLETDRKDTLCLSLGSGLVLWQPAVNAPHVKLFALPGWPFVRCNDAGIDPAGRAWVGSMRNNVKEDGAPFEAAGEDGVLYRVDGTGASTECRRQLGI
jgi:sugar lactone lactonase YvrE